MGKKSKFRLTIIEIILMLAVAGLIALIVFVVLPTLQQSQDETTHRNDISRVHKALVQYQTDNSVNKDNLPAQGSYVVSESGDPNQNDCGTNSACKLIHNYIDTSDGDFIDPDGTPYSLVITSNYSYGPLTWDTVQDDGNDLISEGGGFTLHNDVLSHHTIYVIPGGKCEGEIVKRSSRRHFAILYLLEEDNVYCLDDQQ